MAGDYIRILRVLALITNGLQIGTTIRIQGLVTGGPEFGLNVRNDDAEIDQGPIGLHLVFRYGDILRNTHTKNAYGHEEKEGGFKIHADELFDIKIVTGDTGFLITVNDKELPQFNYRIPIAEAMFIEFFGEAKVHLFEIYNSSGSKEPDNTVSGIDYTVLTINNLLEPEPKNLIAVTSHQQIQISAHSRNFLKSFKI